MEIYEDKLRKLKVGNITVELIYSQNVSINECIENIIKKKRKLLKNYTKERQ